MCSSATRTTDSLDSEPKASTCIRPLFVTIAVLGAACGGTRPETEPPEDVSTSPLRFELQTAEGVHVALEDLTGRRVLLFCFATFDGMSQANLEPVYQLVRGHPEVYVIGVAIGPDAGELLGPWTAAADPLFVTTFSGDGALARGTPEFAAVESVPTFIALDEEGRELGRIEGFATRRDLQNLLLR